MVSLWNNDAIQNVEPFIFWGKFAMKRLLSIVVLCCLAHVTLAQENFPTRPVRLVVPFGPGATDVVSRFMAERMQHYLGQNINVINQPGAIGTTGTRNVAQSAADGYTMTLSNTGTHAAVSSLFRTLGYDPVDSFSHIGTFGRVFWVLQVRSDLPVNNLKEFIAYAKDNPGKVTMPYYSASARLANYMLKTAAGIDIYEVAYKDATQVLTGLRQGDVQASFFLLDVAANHEKLGFIQSLAVASPTRSSVLPNVPAFAETFPGFEMSSWLGLAVAANTPPPIVNRLREALTKGLGEAQTKKWFTEHGVDLFALDPEATVALIKKDMKIWADFVQAAQIPPIQ